MSKQSKTVKQVDEDCGDGNEDAHATPADAASSNAPKPGKASATSQADWVDDLQSNVLIAVRSALINSEPKPNSARSMPKFDLDFAASDDAETAPQPTSPAPPPQKAASPAPAERRRALPASQKTSSYTTIQRPPLIGKSAAPPAPKPTPPPAQPDRPTLETFSRSGPAPSTVHPDRKGSVLASDAPADLVRDLEQALSVPPRDAASEASTALVANVPPGSTANPALRGLNSLKSGLPQWRSRRNSVEALGLVAITTFAVSGVFFYLAPHKERSASEAVRVVSVDASQTTPSVSLPEVRELPDDGADESSSIATPSIASLDGDVASLGGSSNEVSDQVADSPSSTEDGGIADDVAQSEDVARTKSNATVSTTENKVAKLTTTETSTTAEPDQAPKASIDPEALAAARVALRTAIASDPFYSSEAVSAESLAATKALYVKAARLGGTEFPQLVLVLKAGNKNAIAAVAPQFLSRARTMLSQGKVREARTLLKLVESAENSEVALAMARSFDPNYLSSLGNVDAKPSSDDAERWYRRWFEISVKNGQVSADVDIERLIRAIE